MSNNSLDQGNAWRDAVGAVEKTAYPEGINAFERAMLPKAAPSALDTQEGGNHYKSLAIQPVEYIHANGIGYFEGCVIKYVTRWRSKNGIEDLKKARHFLDLLIELEGRKHG